MKKYMLVSLFLYMPLVFSVNSSTAAELAEYKAFDEYGFQNSEDYLALYGAINKLNKSLDSEFPNFFYTLDNPQTFRNELIEAGYPRTVNPNFNSGLYSFPLQVQVYENENNLTT